MEKQNTESDAFGACLCWSDNCGSGGDELQRCGAWMDLLLLVWSRRINRATRLGIGLDIWLVNELCLIPRNHDSRRIIVPISLC